MILKSDHIAGLLEPQSDSKDPLVVVPAPELDVLRQSGAASIDLRLGTWFCTFRQNRHPLMADDGAPARVQSDNKFIKRRYVPFGEQFVLYPQNFVLGTTLEWIRIPNRLAGYVVGKSSWGRRGLIIATAIAVHPGFTGCLTLEITNLGEIPIAISPGIKICQLCLHEVESTSEATDRSSFLGRRLPALGTIRPDPIADKLAHKQRNSL